MRAPQKTQDRARELRRRMTPPEVALWARLRRRTPGYPAFRRQHPVGCYILDFYCAAARLAIEVDGWSHNLGDPDHDRRRDAWLASQGITVMRYAARSVFTDLDEVARSIVEAAVARSRA
jgi:very-short-patch-repair endonuclease